MSKDRSPVSNEEFRALRAWCQCQILLGILIKDARRHPSALAAGRLENLAAHLESLQGAEIETPTPDQLQAWYDLPSPPDPPISSL